MRTALIVILVLALVGGGSLVVGRYYLSVRASRLRRAAPDREAGPRQNDAEMQAPGSSVGMANTAPPTKLASVGYVPPGVPSAQRVVLPSKG